jgi:hypothetical protein
MAPPCCACPRRATAWRESITMGETGVPTDKSGVGESTKAVSCDTCAFSNLSVAGGRPRDVLPSQGLTAKPAKPPRAMPATAWAFSVDCFGVSRPTSKRGIGRRFSGRHRSPLGCGTTDKTVIVRKQSLRGPCPRYRKTLLERRI